GHGDDPLPGLVGHRRVPDRGDRGCRESGDGERSPPRRRHPIPGARACPPPERTHRDPRVWRPGVTGPSRREPVGRGPGASLRGDGGRPRRLSPAGAYDGGMDESLIAVVEIPGGSRNKYEIDKDSGEIFLDRTLFTATRYPADYGYFPNTLAE